MINVCYERGIWAQPNCCAQSPSYSWLTDWLIRVSCQSILSKLNRYFRFEIDTKSNTINTNERKRNRRKKKKKIRNSLRPANVKKEFRSSEIHLRIQRNWACLVVVVGFAFECLFCVDARALGFQFGKNTLLCFGSGNRVENLNGYANKWMA